MTSENSKLLIIWTRSDRDVALNMVLMYAINAQRNRWWDHVTLLVWGPSQKLVLADADVRAQLDAFRAAGGRAIACKTCAANYGIEEELSTAGIEVFGTGMTLTTWLKSDCAVLSF